LGIARNKAVDYFRKGKLQDQVLKTLHNGLAWLPGESIDLLEESELRAEVLCILESIEVEERLVLEWMYLDEISVREIASRLGRSDKAIESVLFRARNSFRQVMKSNERAKELRHASL
jgi:RNA polymerase sigma-70 factor, ECF subfamily